MRMTRLRYMNCSFGCEWLAWVLRQHPRGLAGESGVATGQDLGAKLFGEGAERKGYLPKPEAHVLAGREGGAIRGLLLNPGTSFLRSSKQSVYEVVRSKTIVDRPTAATA